MISISPRIGIGLGADTPEKLCQNIRKQKKALSRWTRTNVLIMDEGGVSRCRFRASKEAEKEPICD